MKIEIRDKDGTRLASADTLSEAIDQLVALCERYRQIVQDLHEERDELTTAQPDTSAVAPEHAAVFAAGWRAALGRKGPPAGNENSR